MLCPFQMLLQNGADPRVYAEDGQTPEQVASHEGLRDMLVSWDVGQTDSLLVKLQAQKEQRAADEKKRREAMQDRYKHASLFIQIMCVNVDCRGPCRNIKKTAFVPFIGIFKVLLFPRFSSC